MKRNHLICITQISAVTIVLAVVATGCTSAARYRCFQDEKALFAVMHKEIQNGDPYEEVSRLLGPGVPAQERMYIATKGLAEKYPDHFPDGFKDTDTVMTFPGGFNFEFRDGKLINHDPSRYAVYKETHIVGSP